MKIIRSINALRSLLNKARAGRQTIGFVPTMGYFHEGHLSLMRRSKKDNNLTVVSIFVNPMQFGPHEDFKSYPRNLKKDVLLAKKEKVDIIFYPSEKEMYPARYLTYVDVKSLSFGLCGRSRPGHFQGVATVVGKLLNIVSPDVMYLGQKDAQQVTVISQMIRDLNFPVEIKVMPTVREPDGLAMSSRNSYLTPKLRSEAAILYASLNEARRLITKGNFETKEITRVMANLIRQKSSAKIDYIQCVDVETLEPLKKLKGKVLIALAAYFGKTRLIDNIRVHIQ